MEETTTPGIDPDGAPALEETAAESDYVATVSFDELGLSEELRRSIADRGYTMPTPVQAKAIPLVLNGRDVIVRSKTGTGKTAAFSIPILEKLPAGAKRPLALVLCPTRELAVQVAQEAAALGQHKDLRVTAIYGGASMDQQVRALEEGAELIVGTPGRVYDHIRRKTLDLSGAMFAVLDEADEMLSMGFYEEVTRILDHLGKSRQTLLFSATVPPDIDRLIRKYLHDPETLLLSGDVYTVEGINHVSYKMVDAYPKPRNLLYLLELENPESAIIFANTRDDTSLVTAVLNRNGYDAELLNGDLPQKERERVMAKIKRGEVRFMVATDIAARGIDISDLTHVINYSLPEDAAVYLHRVGRTGRIGKTGTAISLIGGRDFLTLGTLQKQYGVTFETRNLPTAEEAKKLWNERHIAELREGIGSSVFEAFIPLAKELKTRPDGEHLLAYALKYFFQHHRMDKIAAERAREREAAGVTAEDMAGGKHERRGGERGKRRERGGERGERRERGERGERRERGERPARAEGTERPARAEGAEGTERPARAAAGERRERPERKRREKPAAEATTATPDVPAAIALGSTEGSEPPVPLAVEAATAEGPAAPESEGEASGEAREPRVDRGAKLWVSLGEADGLDVAGVSAALAELTGVESAKFKAVEVGRSHSFVWVERDALEQVLAGHGKTRGETEVRIERSRRRRR